MVEHDMDFVHSIAQRVTVLHQGHVLAEGSMDDAQQDQRVIESISVSDNLLNISGLNQYYGESHTLWDLGLEVPKGKCTCFMGRNGVGKTTLLPTESGDMVFDGTFIVKVRAEQRASLGTCRKGDKYSHS